MRPKKKKKKKVLRHNVKFSNAKQKQINYCFFIMQRRAKRPHMENSMHRINA